MREKDKKRKNKSKLLWLIVLFACITILASYLYFICIKEKENVDSETSTSEATASETSTSEATTREAIISETTIGETNTSPDLTTLDIPVYTGQPYAWMNDNIPFFTSSDLTTKAFEEYSSLDELGRCGMAYACVGKEIMPTEERGEIGHIKPSGWKQAKYFGVVNSKPPYLYNRCHLVAFCLSGENANEKNLITGTRYMNVEGMLPWESKVSSYVDDTGNHVMYRVTPDFRDDELVARGVMIEAYSVEDNGQGICFNVYCYNVQPGVVIDYLTGESREE